MTNDVLGLDFVSLHNVLAQRYHCINLRFRKGTEPQLAFSILDGTGIDNLDADRTRIEVRVPFPETGTSMPGAVVFIHQPVGDDGVITYQIVA